MASCQTFCRFTPVLSSGILPPFQKNPDYAPAIGCVCALAIAVAFREVHKKNTEEELSAMLYKVHGFICHAGSRGHEEWETEASYKIL